MEEWQDLLSGVWGTAEGLQMQEIVGSGQVMGTTSAEQALMQIVVVWGCGLGLWHSTAHGVGPDVVGSGNGLGQCFFFL